MRTAGERRLRDGVTVAVHRNAGLRKVCGCPRRGWAKCPHPWHFNFSWRGTAYRFSLKQYAGKEVTAKSEAERLAQNLRDQIRTGIFRVSASPTGNIVTSFNPLYPLPWLISMLPFALVIPVVDLGPYLAARPGACAAAAAELGRALQDVRLRKMISRRSSNI